MVAGSYEQCSETSGSVNGGKFYDKLRIKQGLFPHGFRIANKEIGLDLRN